MQPFNFFKIKVKCSRLRLFTLWLSVQIRRKEPIKALEQHQIVLVQKSSATWSAKKIKNNNNQHSSRVTQTNAAHKRWRQTGGAGAKLISWFHANREVEISENLLTGRSFPKVLSVDEKPNWIKLHLGEKITHISFLISGRRTFKAGHGSSKGSHSEVVPDAKKVTGWRWAAEPPTASGEDKPFICQTRKKQLRCS